MRLGTIYNVANWHTDYEVGKLIINLIIALNTPLRHVDVAIYLNEMPLNTFKVLYEVRILGPTQAGLMCIAGAIPIKWRVKPGSSDVLKHNNN